MSIKLTKEIDGEKVELDLISLNGKTTIRSANMKTLKKRGFTMKRFKDEGFEIEKS